MEIVRTALYRQLADLLRDEILTGKYPPGTLLPSEAQLSERYKVSRPTVRQALAALRAEGLITVRMGKGSIVRATPTAPATRDRAVYTTGDRGDTDGGGAGYGQPDDTRTTAVEEPGHYRTDADATTAPLLGVVDGEPLFVTDRLLSIEDPTTGTTVRAQHRLYLPFGVAADTPLEGDPFRRPGEVYAILAAAHGPLTWREYVTARMPLPDETAALNLTDGGPILDIIRVTQGADGAPLALEETRTTADGQRLAYTLTSMPTAPDHAQAEVATEDAQ